MGIEEIQEMRPDAKIIVNSILPMTSDRNGKLSSRRAKKPKTNFENHRSLAKEKEVIDKKTKEKEDKKMDEKEVKAVTAAPVRSRFSMFHVFSPWPSAVVINNALKKFCAKHKRIVFFDSYDIFVDTVSDDLPTIDKELMKLTTLGLPTTAGHSAWLDQIERRVKYMMKKYDLKPKKVKKEIDPLSDEEND